MKVEGQGYQHQMCMEEGGAACMGGAHHWRIIVVCPPNFTADLKHALYIFTTCLSREVEFK